VRRAVDESGATGTAVVTGAAGFIGSHLVRRLVSTGWSVRGLDDERTGDWNRVKVSLERIDRSLETMSSETLQAACRGADLLVHLAAEKHNTPGVTPDRALAVNVLATARLFHAAGSAGVSKIVFASSLYAYGSLGPTAMDETDLPAPSTTYGVSKLAGEHLLRATTRQYGTGWSVARLFFIYGPNQHAAGGYPSVIIRNFARIRRGERPVVKGDGTQALDYVYVDDCVEGLLALIAAEHDGATVNLASGRATTVNELTSAMLTASGSDLEPIAGPADWTAGTKRFGSTTHAAEQLGWAASTPLDAGLRRVWESLA
jgi:UDP-glucose 4-epimerase